MITTLTVLLALILFAALLTAGARNEKLGPITWVSEWWDRNCHDSTGRIDTSRMAKMVVLIFIIVFMISMATIFGVVGWQFFIEGKKTGTLLLSPSALKTLGYVVGAMFAALLADYRIARVTNGKGH